MTETVNSTRLREHIEVGRNAWDAMRSLTADETFDVVTELLAHRELLALRQSDTRIEGGDFPSHRFDGAIEVPSRTSDSSGGYWSDDKTYEEAPNPEHVEGDGISVGEMEMVAWNIAWPKLPVEPTSSIALASEVERQGGTVEPLVTLTSATTRIQRAERERDEADQYKWQFLNSTIDRCRMDAAEATARAEKAEAQLADAVKVIGMFLHSVCHETGFAASVRHDSGFAYPWPALDQSEAAARAFLSTIGEKPDAE